MQKIFIIFAVIILSSSTEAQMKMRNLQTIADEPAASSAAPPQIKSDATKTVNFVELNTLGVQKYLTENNYNQAIDLFSKAIEAAAPAGCSGCKYNLGRSFLQVGKYDDAVKVFNELIAADPKNFNAYASLGEAYYKKGLYQESLAFFQKALKLNPKDAITLCNYAVSLTTLEKHQEALENLDKAIKLQPDFTEAYSNRGYALFLLGRPQDALESLQKALTLNPGVAQVHNNLGVVLDRLGKKKEAKAYYEKAVQLKPDYAEAICNLAIIHLEEGDRDAAYGQLKTLEKVDFKLADQLRSVIWSKYVVDASQVKPKN